MKIGLNNRGFGGSPDSYFNPPDDKPMMPCAHCGYAYEDHRQSTDCPGFGCAGGQVDVTPEKNEFTWVDCPECKGTSKVSACRLAECPGYEEGDFSRNEDE